LIPNSTSLSASPFSTSSSPSSSPPLPPPPPIRTPQFKLGLCQLQVTEDKKLNLSRAAEAVGKAVSAGAKIVVLPEMFNCPYSNASFGPYSEVLPEVGTTAEKIILHSKESPSPAFLSNLASRHQIYLIAGSIPERDQNSKSDSHSTSGHLYNTSLTFSPSGDLVAKHRKVHLFDINVPGKMVFKESETLTAGNEITVFDTNEFGRIGVAICYDLRFPELSELMREKGAKMLIFPAAFNTTTGPLHWELLIRSRAVDNQVYVAACSPARSLDPTKGYQAWGHSIIVSPWGRVVKTIEEKEGIVVGDVDLREVDEVRNSIPVLKQKRTDLYGLVEVKKP